MMLFWNGLAPNSPLYNVPIAFRIAGPVNVSALEDALTLVRSRHQILRTNYAVVNGEQVQLIRSAGRLSIPLVDCCFQRAKPTTLDVRKLVDREAQRPFNLRSDSMLRAALVRSEPEDQVLIMTMHHIAADGWSLGVLVHELIPAYDAFSRGATPQLPELPMQYSDYAVWEKEHFQKPAFQETIAFWKEQMSGCPDTCEVVPIEHPRPAQQSFRGSTQKITLPLEFFKQLAGLGQQYRASVFMVAVTALDIMLSRYSGQTDIILGVPMANRGREEFLSLIGCFMNQITLRCDLSGNPTVANLLEQVREQVLKAFFHQTLPFTELVRLLKPKRSPNQNPLFQVEFLYQSYDMPLPDWQGLKVTRADFETNASKFDLSVIIETREEFEIKFEYNTDLFEVDTIRAMLRHYHWVLQNVLHHPEAHLSDFPTGFPCPIESSAVSAATRPAV
jgi:hypothetical protein